MIEAKKDTYYRMLNNPRYNWRTIVALIAIKIMEINKKIPLKEKLIIVDGSCLHKTGKNMEFVSYHHDHTTVRCQLGYQLLQIGLYDGMNFIPIDFSFHVSKNRPNNHIREIDRRTNGWKRRRESL